MARPCFGELLDACPACSVVRFLALACRSPRLGAFAILALRVLPAAAAVGAVLTYALMPHAYDGIVAGGGVTRGTGLFFAMLAMWMAASPSGLIARRASVGLGSCWASPRCPTRRPPSTGRRPSTVLVLPPRSSRGQPATRGGGRRRCRPGRPAVAPRRGHHPRPDDRAGSGAPVGASRRHGPDHWPHVLRGRHSPTCSWSSGRWAWPSSSLRRRCCRCRPLCHASSWPARRAGFIGAVPWSLLAGAPPSHSCWRGSAHRSPADRFIRTGIAPGSCSRRWSAAWVRWSTRSSRLQRVSEDQVAAMTWVRDETEPGTRFIVAAIVIWGADEISEWFPAVAQRQSVATVQGSEWLGRRASRAAPPPPRRPASALRRPTDAWRSGLRVRRASADAWLFIPKGRVNGPLSPRTVARRCASGPGQPVLRGRVRRCRRHHRSPARLSRCGPASRDCGAADASGWWSGPWRWAGSCSSGCG